MFKGMIIKIIFYRDKYKFRYLGGKPMELNEIGLIKKAKYGDIEAFAHIINIYKNKIFSICYRMLGNKEEAEDISQETFLKVYSNLEKYNEKYKFSTWIYKVATNLCIDRIRKRKPIYSLDSDWDNDEAIDWYSIIADKGKTPEEVLIDNEQSNLVQEIFIRLPIKYRTIMTLRYVNELSLQEISEVVGLPTSTVKTRLHRGREYARQFLMVNDVYGERSNHNEL